MSKLLHIEEINSKGIFIGKIKITKLNKNGVYRIEFDGTRGNELSESYFLQLSKEYYDYLHNNNLTFPGGIICAAESYVCFDSKYENINYVFNKLKEDLLNYFNLI